MKAPQGKVLELEREIERSVVGDNFDWSRAGNLAEGTRRALWLAVEALSARAGEEPGSIAVEFVLPKGAYATTVLSEVFDTSEARTDGASADPDAPETLDS
jgi:tRNA(Glu) U13 pseudouridine synthase TruD